MKTPILLVFASILCLAACEKKPAQYVLKNPAGAETSNHYTDEGLELPRKYIRVLPFEFKREKRIIETRSESQKRRNRHYFPKR